MAGALFRLSIDGKLYSFFAWFWGLFCREFHPFPGMRTGHRCLWNVFKDISLLQRKAYQVPKRLQVLMGDLEAEAASRGRAEDRIC